MTNQEESLGPTCQLQGWEVAGVKSELPQSQGTGNRMSESRRPVRQGGVLVRAGIVEFEVIDKVPLEEAVKAFMYGEEQT